MRDCKHREDLEKIEKSLKQLNDNEKKIDESKSNEMHVSECLGSNDK